MRLLLIEDDQDIASFITSGLKESGYAVDSALNGTDGQHMAFHEPYDVLIVDLMLPDIDGLDIIENLRKSGINTPVLILSAKRNVDDSNALFILPSSVSREILSRETLFVEPHVLDRHKE